MSENTEFHLSEKMRQEIDAWIAKYPENQQQSAVLAALHIVQDNENGWLTDSMLNAVADYLAMPKIAVYEVATFYNLYDLQPVGRHKISLCTSISCMLGGCDKIGEHLQQRLGINYGETSADGKFTLKRVECLGACVGAPMMQLDKDYHEKLTPEKVDELLNKCG